MFLSQKKYALAIILLCGILLRFFIFRLEREHIVNYWDSINYGRIGYEIATKGKISDVLNAVRPPLYPLLIAGSYIVNRALPEYKDAYLSLKDSSGLLVIWLQIVTGIISLGFFYAILKLVLSPKLAFWLGLLYAIHPLIFPWDLIVLTESLSFSLLVMYLFAVVLVVKKFTLQRMFGMVFTALIITWVRSSFILLLPLTIPLLVIKNKNWKTIIGAYMGLIIFLLPIFFHIYINELNYGYKTLQVHGEINMFGRMTSDKYAIPKIPNNQISQWMQKNFILGQYHTPIPILEAIDIDYYHNRKLIQEMKTYTNQAMRDNFPAYMVNVISDVPEIFKVSFTLPRSPKWFVLMQELFIYLQLFASIFLVFLPIVIVRLWKTKQLIVAVTSISGVYVSVIYATGLFFGYTDTARYSTSVIPILIVYCGGLLELYGNIYMRKVMFYIKTKVKNK